MILAFIILSSFLILPNSPLVSIIIEVPKLLGAPLEVVENLQSIEDEGEIYESIQEIWPDYPTDEDYLWNEDEY